MAMSDWCADIDARKAGEARDRAQRRAERDALPPADRLQYRRLEREDAGGLDAVHFNDSGEVSLKHYERTGEVRLRPEPELAAGVAVPIVPEDVYGGIPEEWLPLARKAVENFQLPVCLPAHVPTDAARAIMACVYHMRHHNEMPLRLGAEAPTDPTLPGWDLVNSINRLCRLYREETLARAGHRMLAHGVFPIDPQNPSKGYRAQFWDTSKEKKNSIGEVVIGGKHHVCYKKTEEEAWDALAAWFLRHRGIDGRKYLCYHPKSAISLLSKMMRRAAQLANDYVEVDVKELFGGTDEDEWD